MCITEDRLVESYGKATTSEKQSMCEQETSIGPGVMHLQPAKSSRCVIV